MTTLSIVISTKNDEDRIKKCLESIKWADEIIVVDGYSTDNTRKIAKKYTKKVWIIKDIPNKPAPIEIARNFGILSATKDWILILDSDEIVTPELRQEIKDIITKDNNYNGYYVRRKNIVLNKWLKHGGYWDYEDIKLFKRGIGEYPLIPHSHLQVSGSIGFLKNPVIHNSYRNVSDWLNRINKYSTLDAEIREQSSKGHIIFMPLASFIRCFFLKKAFRDGFRGFIASVFTAFYTFVKYVKIWEKKMKK